MEMQDWKTQEQKLYLPPFEPQILQIPKHCYFAIGCRDASRYSDFKERVEVLTALSEAVRNIQSLGYSPPDYMDYQLYPVEMLIHPGAEGIRPPSFSLMMRQPGFIDNETIDRAFTAIHRLQKFPLLPEAAFEEFQDGLSVQLLSSKKKETAAEAFGKLEHFLLVNNLKRRSSLHREIYPELSTDSVVYRIFVETAE